MQNLETIKNFTLSEVSRSVIMHHLSAFQKNDLDAVLSDYTNESIFITQDAIYKGPEEIRPFFSALMNHFPKQHSSLDLDRVVVNNELVYIVWRAITPSLEVSIGTDTFIIKNGKIFQQTFAGQLKFME